MPNKHHIQRGYAVLEYVYPIDFLQTYEERYTPEHQAQTHPVHEIKSMRRTEIYRATLYARCAKNETSDEFLSRWYSEVARPEAERLIKMAIEKAQEDSKRRVKEWEAHSNAGWIKPNSPLPPTFEYDEFDAKRLGVKNIYCSENEPAEGNGNRVRWD